MELLRAVPALGRGFFFIRIKSSVRNKSPRQSPGLPGMNTAN
jgi:hypothetical protein